MRRSLVPVAVLLLAVSAAGRTAAQAPRPVGTWRPVANPLAGWHALGPVLLSVTAVAGLGTGDLDVPEPGTHFILAAAEPGIDGHQLGLHLLERKAEEVAPQDEARLDGPDDHRDVVDPAGRQSTGT